MFYVRNAMFTNKMDGVYFALKCDNVASRAECVSDVYGKNIKQLSTRSVSLTVRAGSLWQRIDGSSSGDDTYEPISVARTSTTVVLLSCEQENVRLVCSLSDLYRLNSEIECQLLLAVDVEDDRLKLIEIDDGYQLKVGRQVWAAWKDQLQSRGYRVQSLGDEIKVYVYGKLCGNVRYVGHLAGRVGFWFGIELITPFTGMQCCNGSYRNKRYFDCNDNCGIFVAVNNISLCEIQSIEPGVSVPSRVMLVGDRLEVVARRACRSPSPPEDALSSLSRPLLELGDRVVWISDYGPELGTVRWIGILPDSRIKEFTIGVEFDSPIGTGTGKYNHKQLFRTRQNHASLIPCLGLMKAEEFYGSAARVPPPPSFVGDPTLSTLSSTTTLDTSSKSGSRHDTVSVRSAPGDDEDEIGNLTGVHLSAKSLKRDHVDARVDIAEQTGSRVDEWRSSTQQGPNVPRLGKSTDAQQSPLESYSTTSPVGDLNSETNSTSERSIYDREPEHCYQNVQKDETGRLLNRDTTAFSAVAVECSNERSTRSSSGDDVSNMFGAPVSKVSDHLNFINDGSKVTMSAMQRNSRSVDNIHNDDTTSNRMDSLATLTSAKSTAGSDGFSEQLPYHTGRSTFYKRVDANEENNTKSLATQHTMSTTSSAVRQQQSANVNSDESPTRAKASHSHSSGNCPTGIKRPPAFQQSDKRIFTDSHPTDALHHTVSRRIKTSCEPPVAVTDVELSIQTTHDGIEQLCKSLSFESNVNGLVPKRLSRADLVGIDLDVGSLVEFDIDSITHYGVIRWIGYLTDRTIVIAGIELEEESREGVDSILCGNRVFDCATKKAYFELLSKLHKDRRFAESSKFVHRMPDQLFGSIECLSIPGSLAPPLYGAHCLGPDRGIQGHHNSCYMDATLFSMFAFSTVFDAILHRPRRHGNSGSDIKRYEEVQSALRDGIVNPLRKNFYVRADKVLHLRELLNESSSVQGLMEDEKDPEEFLNSLLQQTLKADPFIHLSSGQDSYFYQLFLDKDDHIVLPTTQQLLELSFLQSDVKLSETPSCLVLQMPRFGRNYKMYKRIVPSLYLDITDILLLGVRECAICGCLATYECKQCFHEFGESLSKIAFCDVCIKKSHNRVKRSSHQPAPLATNADYQRVYESSTGLMKTALSAENIDESLREKMELFAVICIQTSHYVAFVKSGSGRQAPWLFFDSMADRKGEQHGYNVPNVECCPYLPAWLDDTSYTEIHSHRDDRSLPEQMRRLLCDAYICMYQSCSLAEYR